MAAMSKRSYKENVKFGIKIPRTWDEAVAIDKENGDTQQWQDAVREETTKVRITFKIWRTERRCHRPTKRSDAISSST
jgi:hypothetical protein